ncbi:hypothetical protein M426DRAFT_53784 [Hypoxylon sp. CI-4A]|nr:hypothetical protein M426DRAFT_53784 [Hypoxylon sp. CI-4A]
MSPTRGLSSESSVGAAADTFSNITSLSSTPPTTIADSFSLASSAGSPKNENSTALGRIDDPADLVDADAPTEVADSIIAAVSTPTISGRSRRARLSTPIYNIAQLAGTAVHGRRRAKGDDVADRKRRHTTIPQTRAGGDEYNEDDDVIPAEPPKQKEAETPRRVSTRSSGVQNETLAGKISSLGKQSKKAIEKSVSKMSRELRRLQDTDEFVGIDNKPVVYTTWANGKYVTDSQPSRKRARAATETSLAAAPEPEPTVEEAPAVKKPRVKKYLDRGLYAGQETPVDPYKGLTPPEKKKLASLPELAPSRKVNKVLPMPIYNGARLLVNGRDFKLPFDICNPLPPGQPKPDDFRKITKNRFVGDAGAYWKKTPHFKDYQSKCVCTPEDGCGESCQNRIMLYECDETNCNVGPRLCQNRAFARLQQRIKEGGKFRVGVEVQKTEDRGYGIRANRCFDPNQIIMEYTGEIITEDECDRRMNEEYKDNQCYYLMSFDQNMIIDATTGSIARFVNHSCSPNCRMIKWIVSGQPRMALFAGDRPIMTGEELTYDYNFDPFSAKNVQKCLCGSENCRGVLGPKPKEVKQPKPSAEASKKGASTGKRKLKDVDGAKEDVGGSATKKRKIKATKEVKAHVVKRTFSSAGLKAAKGAATAIKRSVSSISVNAKAVLGSKSSPGRKTAAVRKSRAVVRTYSKVQTKLPAAFRTSPRKPPSRGSGSTIVAAGAENAAASSSSSSSSSSTSKTAAVPTEDDNENEDHSGSTSGEAVKEPLAVVDN